MNEPRSLTIYFEAFQLRFPDDESEQFRIVLELEGCRVKQGKKVAKDTLKDRAGILQEALIRMSCDESEPTFNSILKKISDETGKNFESLRKDNSPRSGAKEFAVTAARVRNLLKPPLQ